MNNLISKTLFISTIVILTIVSCSEDIANDNSLTISEYRNSGMPDPAKKWLSHDYALAFSVLQNIKSTQPHKLPLKGSSKSGEIYSRLLSWDNMQFMNEESITNEQKVYFSKDFLKVCENTIELYTMNTSGQQYYHRELADAYLFGLEVTDMMLDLNSYSKKMMMFDNTDPVQSFYLSGLFNLLRTQNRASQFSNEDHHLIIEGVSQSVKKNEYWFDEILREDLTKAFQQISDSTKAKNFTADYLHLIGDL